MRLSACAAVGAATRMENIKRSATPTLRRMVTPPHLHRCWDQGQACPAYEAVRWPKGKVEGGKGSGDRFLNTAEIGRRGHARQPVEPKTFLSRICDGFRTPAHRPWYVLGT